MSGASQISIAPSEFQPIDTPLIQAAKWYRGIPDAGIEAFSVPAVAGLPTCRNLMAASPPTLLEAYEIYSLAIGWGIGTASSLHNIPVASIELALLVNDQVRFTVGDEQQMIAVVDADHGLASGALTVDLVNPLTLGARERLSLRVGVRLSESADFVKVFVGTQAGPGAVIVPYESTISYRVLDLPGSRRL